jgi:hypothetical protein
MGLDCVPLGRPKPGHEAEWQQLMEILYSGGTETEKDEARRCDISIFAYESVGAPLVGESKDADEWALQHKPADRDLSDAEWIEEIAGHHVLALAPDDCDGLPMYSNAPAYDEVDETSFRGQFLQSCVTILEPELLLIAWTIIMPPEQAVEYGKALLDAAKKAQRKDFGPFEFDVETFDAPRG